VIATHNRKKADEMATILSALMPEVEILTLADYPNAPEPEENGTTYAENASIKAESAAGVTREWALADDAGLEIDALNGEPGLHSKRFEGENTPFSIKMARILERMKDVPEEKRTARFRCCVALARAGDQTKIFEATCEGRVAREPRGEGGFGYDPIFFLPERNRTMAELTPKQKHEISHRGKALRAFAAWVKGERGEGRG